MAWIDFEGWAHGRVWKGKSGRLSFYIRRGGQEVATGASTLSGALAALERYEKTGNAHAPQAVPVVLDLDLATELLAYSKAKGNSVDWRRTQRQHLHWWSEVLGGRDLRAGRQGSITISDIRQSLAGAPSARQREAVIRSLYSFLRGEDRIETVEDPTFGKPRIAPAGRPAQETTDKAIDSGDLRTVIGYLDEMWMARGKTDEERARRGRRWGDLLRFLKGTGAHVTEAARFAAGGTIEPMPGGRKPTKEEAGVLVVPLHKNGMPWRAAVAAEVLPVASRLRAAGPFSVSVFYAELRKASAKCGAKVLPGRFRHTLAKDAVESGATMEQVGTYLGHKSPATTKKFYATLAVPMRPPTRRR